MTSWLAGTSTPGVSADHELFPRKCRVTSKANGGVPSKQKGETSWLSWTIRWASGSLKWRLFLLQTVDESGVCKSRGLAFFACLRRVFFKQQNLFRMILKIPLRSIGTPSAPPLVRSKNGSKQVAVFHSGLFEPWHPSGGSSAGGCS